MTSQQSSRIVISCTSCDRKLAIPGNKGALNVTCPHCSHAFVWQPVVNDHCSEQSTPTKNPLKQTPRMVGIVYIIASITAGYGVNWFDSKADDNILMVLFFMLALALTFYLAFRAIRTITRLGVGKSIAILLVLQVTLPFIIPYLSEPASTLLSGTIFEGRNVDNTTPSQLDDLMENWE